MEHSTEKEHEDNFVKVFIAVLIALTLFTLFCIFVARGLAAGASDPDDHIVRTALLDRIAPVGGVNTSADQIDTAQATATTASGDASGEPETGEQLVARACAACHQAGVANAPKIDDDAAWAERREAGLEALVASVINGKGAMPARAGTDLSDEQITLAVQSLAGFESTDSSAVETESGDASAATETATAETATAATETDNSEEAATEQAADAATTTATAATTASAIVVSEKAKTVAESLCIGCHLSGVANAPKIGDKAEWDKRAEKGMDEMVKIVAAGKGAMPARGGSDLTDDELAGAIHHLMNK